MLLLPQNNQLVLITNQSPIMVAMNKQPVAYSTEFQLSKTNAYQNAPASRAALVPPDRTSLEGKFGWTQFGDEAVPYLFRGEEKYVSLKMILTRVYNIYKKYFTKELYGCCDINLIKMTVAEARLLNEINSNHCDHLFGEMAFTANDDLITLKDAINMYHFLHFCYETLIRKNEKTTKVCGFIRINRQNCIPYVTTNTANGKLYVPLVYFDGDHVFLEQRSIQLQGWPLAFLKLCCKIHGIGKSSFDKKSMAVVDLELVKKFFPPETLFEESWPAENKLDCLLAQKSSNTSEIAQHIPTTVTKATTAPTTRQKANTNLSKRPTLNYRRPSPPPYPGNGPKPVHQTSVTPRLPIGNYSTPSPSDVTNALRPVYDNKTGCILLQIPNHSISEDVYPYFTLRIQFGNKFLYRCINMFPLDSTTMLATLEEVAAVSQIPMELFIKSINQLKFSVYLPNAYQQKLLADCGVQKTMGLINVHNFIRYFGAIRDVCLSMSIKR